MLTPQSGKEVMHHKWLVKSDFKDSDKKDKKGDAVTIATDAHARHKKRQR